jgi:hypothetical protein
MADIPIMRVAEIGFAEFTALLLTETLDAVISAQLSQEERIQEMATAVSLDPAAYAGSYISAEQLRVEIVRLFPGVGGKSSVDQGEPYLPAEGSQTEVPPLLDVCGYSIRKDDLQKGEQGMLMFSARGAVRIADCIAIPLAVRQQSALKNMTARGVPRVLVDHGRVSAKLTFRLDQLQTSTAGTPTVPFKNKLRVQPVNSRGPEYLSLKTDITSEVEITFKTIID